MLSLLVVGSPAARACAAQDPIDTARVLHAKHHDFSRNDQGLKEILSPSLWQMLVRNWKCEDGGDVCAIDADPWTDAQDGEMLSTPTFKLEAGTATTAKVEASYRFGWKESPDKATDEKSFVLLVKDAKSGCWRVDDLLGAHGNSLAKALREYR